LKLGKKIFLEGLKTGPFEVESEAINFKDNELFYTKIDKKIRIKRGIL